MTALRIYGIAVLVFVICIQVSAAPTVIYDSGKTEPITRYLPQRASHSAHMPQPSVVPSQRKVCALPVSTPSMRPGKVATYTRRLPLPRPLFLLGDDALSQSWLQENRLRLKAIGAVGLLVEANDQQAVDRMTALADGVPLTPSSAESFAHNLGLTHYPVLLSSQGWEQ